MADFPLYGEAIEVGEVGTVTATTQGTTITASGTANTKGSYTELIASTAGAINGFTLNIGGFTIASTADFLLDLAIGAGGSEEVIIANVLLSVSPGSDLEFYKSTSFPINIPAGSRVAARIQSTLLSSQMSISLNTVPSFFSSGPLFHSCIELGANTSDSGGLLVDPGGTINTKGSWVEFTSSLSEDIRGILVLQGNRANSTNRTQRVLFDVGVGSGGNEEIIMTDIFSRITPFEQPFGMNSFVPVSVVAGTRLAIRSQNSDNNATDRLIDYVIYGLV